MAKYSRLTQRALELKRLYGQMTTHAVPSKAVVKRAASQSPFARKDKELLSQLPGGGYGDLVKQVTSNHRARVATPQEECRIKNSRMNSNTTTWRAGRA